MTSLKLTRTLTLWPLIIMGLAYMTPLIVLGTFGIIAEASNGTVPMAFLITTFAMLFTANSYGIMARRYPIAGSAYTFATKSIDSRVGFMVGWTILLDYFFLPMVIWLIGAAYLGAQFPEVPQWLFLIGFVVLTTCINYVGVKAAAKLNSVLMIFQLAAMVIFVALSLGDIYGNGGITSLFSLTPFFNESSSLSIVLAGSSIAAYAFLGFDAITTFTEETIEPEKTVPKAIMLCTLFAGVIYVGVGYTTQLVHPGFIFNDTDSAAFEIAAKIGGNFFAAIFLAAMITAQFMSGISAQASVSRLLFAMGRDGVLPKKIFGFLHPKYLTPIGGVLLSAIAASLALFFDVMQAASLINFGAFVAFIFVNMSVIFTFVKDTKKGVTTGSKILNLVFPAIGTIVTFFLMTKLDLNALTVGSIWLGLGFIYLVYLTKGFTQPTPTLHFEES
ncbi:amino acid permease [Psychromonas sp. SP041]|uniref:APC family permease n=1 Tax=Psychromonas sp. SP041 TaxID=1365007 RepID=UPI00046EC45A|nr:amino acid permease [Psychromonas sp. SP041]